jgi:ABC-type hemin transport system substrate-binding protein
VAPQRIVSLVPSLTELVFFLGRGESLVGRTKFCTEPAGLVGAIPAFGGTKNPALDRIIAARPDLVIANKEENRREDIESLHKAGREVLLTDPNTVAEAVTMIRELGRVLDARKPAEALAGEVESALATIPRGAPVAAYCAVWHNPMMGLGAATYGNSLLEACGARNVLAERERYPEVTLDELRALSPNLILLPDEPFPFDAGHAALYSQIAPARLVDGKLVWWYGPRMPAAIRELSAIIEEAGHG